MRTRAVLVLALVAACSAPRPRTGSGEPVLSVQGRIAGGPARFGAADLAQLPRRSFRGVDPRGGAGGTWDGLALGKLLGDELEIQRGADFVLVQGAGGYEAAIPLSVVRQLRPVLADTLDGAPLARARPQAAPLVLAWPTAEAPGLQYDPRARWWWVDGVRKVEVLSWVGTYGRALRVPPGAADEARPGAEAFQNACMMCHRLRGTGGTRGPELTEKLSEAGAVDPFAEAVRRHASIAGAEPVAETSPAAVRQISSFLRAVAISGAPQPQDEPPPEPPPPPVPPPPGVIPPPR